MFTAGQVLDADDLEQLVVNRISQGSDQDVTSSITLVDSAIAVAVDGLAEVRVTARYTSLAGGIRFAWSATGTVTASSRSVLSAGSATTTTDASHNIANMRHRQLATLTEAQLIAHITTATTYSIDERLIVDGIGTLTFRFAQETSSASATTLMAASHATIQRIEVQ